MKYNGLIIPRSYNDYFSRSDPQAIRDIVAMSTDAQLNTESAAPIQNKAVAKLIPATASEENQLADKNFVNSTVGTNTANYIYKTDASGDNVPFDSIEELEAYSGTVTNNDYAFVTGTDENGNKYFDRYKANVDGDVVIWAKEYRLNNSSFTAEQWAAVESGITAELVGKIGDAGIIPITTANYNALSEEEKMSDKLFLLTDAENGFIAVSDTVESGNMNAVTSNAVNTAIVNQTKLTQGTGTLINGATGELRWLRKGDIVQLFLRNFSAPENVTVCTDIPRRAGGVYDFDVIYDVIGGKRLWIDKTGLYCYSAFSQDFVGAITYIAE